MTEAEDAFFGALLAGDTAALARVLTDDFVLVGVADGQVVPRDALLDLVGSGRLRFLDIAREPAEVSVRHRDGVAVVVGRTRMAMSFDGNPLAATSRYTHVYVRDGERWLLLAAQGTPTA